MDYKGVVRRAPTLGRPSIARGTGARPGIPLVRTTMRTILSLQGEPCCLATIDLKLTRAERPAMTDNATRDDAVRRSKGLLPRVVGAAVLLLWLVAPDMASAQAARPDPAGERGADQRRDPRPMRAPRRRSGPSARAAAW